MSADKGKEIQLQLLIADRHYPLRVREEEANGLYEAERMVNEKVRNFQHIYAGKDKQDFLAMCALTFAAENTALKKNISSTSEPSPSADDITDLLRILSSVTV
jgi:hypothetical protein